MNYKKIAVKNKDKNSNSSLLDELLSIRGITKKKDIEKFLNPSRTDFISPYAFCDMEKTVKRIKEALEKKQKILIWGDFDCDGVTSSTILYKALKELKADILIHIPDRLKEGHGLNSNALIPYIAHQKVKLIITVDCGISNINEIKLLKSFGTDVIITDHHTTDNKLPDAYAIINAQVQGALKENLSSKEIEALTYNSGSVVAYKLAMALLEDIDNNDLKDELLVIASCGAIADVVPLKLENRAMVKETLKLLNFKKEQAHKGIYRLLNKNLQDKEITSSDIAFILAPRINAVGRLDNALLSFDFLNETIDNKLDFLIGKLDSLNEVRKRLCNDTYLEIEKYLKENPEETKKPAIILLNPNWHVGIIGIVASKVVENYNKPCFLMTKDENNNARCSIRSNDLINVYQVLKENEELFLGFGGHRLAGGCSFPADDFIKVKEALLETIKNEAGDIEPDNTLYADIELKSDDINLELLDTINKLEPFGQDNDIPLFAMFDVTFEDFKKIGKEQEHLRLIFCTDNKKFQAVRWSENNVLIPKNTKCDIAFYPRLNEFNGEKSVQLEIVDMYSPLIKDLNKSYKIFDHRQKTDIMEQVASYTARKNLNIGIWAKTIKVKEFLSKYQDIKNNFMEKLEHHDDLMLFDYPVSIEELKELINKVKPSKIHLMRNIPDDNLENYIKQTLGMIKYCFNHLKGEIDIQRLSQTLGMSEKFVQLVLEILENTGSINILDINKIEYVKPCNYSEFKEDSMYEYLKEEFISILEFKKALLNCDAKEFEQMLEL